MQLLWAIVGLGLGAFTVTLLVLILMRGQGVDSSLVAVFIVVAGFFCFGSLGVWIPYRASVGEEGLTLLSLLATRRIAWSQVDSYRYLGSRHGLVGRADEANVWVWMRYRRPNRRQNHAARGLFMLPAVDSDFLRAPGTWVTLIDAYVPERNTTR